MKTKLTAEDFAVAARSIGCQTAALRAVVEVEAKQDGFLPSGLPVILFERHKFSKYTNSIFDASHPAISNRTPGGYLGGQREHERLDEACQLDRTAGLMSASWGLGQIMGFNYRECGYTSLQDFINDMFEGEPTQLKAMVGFIKNDSVMVSALRNCDWAAFARRYNGSNYLINKYDTKLASAFAKWGGR